MILLSFFFFFFSSRRRHTRCSRDWSSDVCSSDLVFHRHDVARLRGGRARRGGRRISGARAALRRAAGSGGGMSAISGRTRLGPGILGAGPAPGGGGGGPLGAARPRGQAVLLATPA